MKKILIICISIFMVLNLTGCDSNNKGSHNIDVLDGELDYVLFRDKKIYLTENSEQYVLQFQGLGCKLNRNMDINNITSKEHKFYQLSEDDFDITCPDLEIQYPADFGAMLDIEEYYDNTMHTLNSVDGRIYYWSFGGGIDESLYAYFNGKKIVVYGENASNKDDVIKVMGSDYEYEEENNFPWNGWFDLKYTINDLEYKFSFNDDNQLIRIYVIK